MIFKATRNNIERGRREGQKCIKVSHLFSRVRFQLVIQFFRRRSQQFCNCLLKHTVIYAMPVFKLLVLYFSLSRNWLIDQSFSLSGKLHNFKKYKRSRIDSLGTAYDYGSIMHYGSKYFSKNNKETIKPKQPGVWSL